MYASCCAFVHACPFLLLWPLLFYLSRLFLISRNGSVWKIFYGVIFPRALERFRFNWKSRACRLPSPRCPCLTCLSFRVRKNNRDGLAGGESVRRSSRRSEKKRRDASISLFVCVSVCHFACMCVWFVRADHSWNPDVSRHGFLCARLHACSDGGALSCLLSRSVVLLIFYEGRSENESSRKKYPVIHSSFVCSDLVLSHASLICALSALALALFPFSQMEWCYHCAPRCLLPTASRTACPSHALSSSLSLSICLFLPFWLLSVFVLDGVVL